jgi:hypothetical protein
MDVYHKVLAKLYELSEGRETVDLDLSDITKQLGYFPSRDQIAAQMMQDGWVTETARKYVVRITHWGVAEAKKTAKNAGKDSDAAKKNATRLVSNIRELLVAAELFADKLTADELKLAEKHSAEVAALIKTIRSEL